MSRHQLAPAALLLVLAFWLMWSPDANAQQLRLYSNGPGWSIGNSSSLPCNASEAVVDAARPEFELFLAGDESSAGRPSFYADSFIRRFRQARWHCSASEEAELTKFVLRELGSDRAWTYDLQTERGSLVGDLQRADLWALLGSPPRRTSNLTELVAAAQREIEVRCTAVEGLASPIDVYAMSEDRVLCVAGARQAIARIRERRLRLAAQPLDDRLREIQEEERSRQRVLAPAVVAAGEADVNSAGGAESVDRLVMAALHRVSRARALRALQVDLSLDPLSIDLMLRMESFLCSLFASARNFGEYERAANLANRLVLDGVVDETRLMAGIPATTGRFRNDVAAFFQRTQMGPDGARYFGTISEYTVLVRYLPTEIRGDLTTLITPNGVYHVDPSPRAFQAAALGGPIARR